VAFTDALLQACVHLAEEHYPDNSTMMIVLAVVSVAAFTVR